MIPKAEMHCHLEGSIPPNWRSSWRTKWPRLARRADRREGIYVWKDFWSFLDAYDRVCTTLRQPRDFGDVLYAYLAGAAREGAKYVEMFCSPERPAALGISYADWLDSLEQAIDRARRDFGIEGRIIIICIRHLGPDKALAMVRRMVAEPHPYVVGFGMGGDEAKFARRLRAGLSAGP